MKYARYIIIILLASLLVWGIFWAKGKAGQQVCQKVDIRVENYDSSTFVNPEGIMQYLDQCHLRLKGTPMADIDLKKVEQALAKSPYLESGECVKGEDGVLLVKVRQLVPVMRVIDGDNMYYVNREGKRMPASTSFSSDVPIVKGHFTAAYPPQRLIPLINYVSGDSALNALVAMFEYRDSNNIYMIPNITGHVVNLGDASGFENKFKKLLLFYKKVMPEKGWTAYDTISVKWRHQVVGNLRSKKVIVEQVDTTGFDNNENTRPDDDVLRSAPPEKTEPAPAATKPAEKKAEKKEVKKHFKKLEKKKLPENFDYHEISGLRIEATQKLNLYQPLNIGQASRISGVTPADVSVILVYLEQLKYSNPDLFYQLNSSED